MKLYRYMSLKEFSKFSAGCEMINNNHFTKNRTSSNDFCFLTEKTVISDEGEVLTPSECITFLQGIVTNDVLVEFETTTDFKFNETYGIYINPFSTGWNDYISIKEISAEVYNKDILHPLRYGLVSDFRGKVEWYNFN